MQEYGEMYDESDEMDDESDEMDNESDEMGNKRSCCLLSQLVVRFS